MLRRLAIAHVRASRPAARMLSQSKPKPPSLPGKVARPCIVLLRSRSCSPSRLCKVVQIASSWVRAYAVTALGAKLARADGVGQPEHDRRHLAAAPPRRLVVIIIIVVVVVVRAPLRPVDVLDELAAVRRAPERVGPLRK